MALIICKECRRQFSDLAQACPGCGAPTSYSVDASQPPAAPLTHTPAITPASPATPVEPVYTVAAPVPPAAGITTPSAPEPVTPTAYQFVVSHSANNDSMQQPQRRQVGPLLVIAIFFLPWLFYWLLLRDGYGNLVRTLGFMWLLLCSAAALALHYGLAERTPQPSAEIIVPASSEQPKEDLSNPVFYPLSSQNPAPAVATSTPEATTTTAPADQGITSQPPVSEHENGSTASIYASSDDTEALQQTLGTCLQQQAGTGNYTLSDNGKSIAKMISACYSDFKPWFDQCLANTHDAKACNLDAIDMAQGSLQLAGH